MPATSTDPPADAARNNALWCDAVARSNDQPTAFHESHWVNGGAFLPLYPSVVTLNPAAPPDLMAAVADLPRGAAVKDSFAALDLTPLGFDTILTGTWLHRPAGPLPDRDVSMPAEPVRSPDDLRAWVDAWGGNEPRGKNNFRPGLLDNEDIQFMSVQAGGAITGGAVFNAGPDGVVGLSNLFGAGATDPAILAALIAPHAGRQVVGYEVEETAVAPYESLGFSKVGVLRIWLRTTVPSEA